MLFQFYAVRIWQLGCNKFREARVYRQIEGLTHMEHYRVAPNFDYETLDYTLDIKWITYDMNASQTNELLIRNFTQLKLLNWLSHACLITAYVSCQPASHSAPRTWRGRQTLSGYSEKLVEIIQRLYRTMDCPLQNCALKNTSVSNHLQISACVRRA